MKVGRWSTTAANNNATPPDGWPEGQAPSTVNDCARENMAAIKTAMQDMDFFDHDFTPTFINANSFSVPGDQTARIVAGRQLKLFDATTHVRAVGSASFTTVTTISLGAGTALTSSLSSFAVGIIDPNNSAIPNNFNRISASAIETTTLTASGAVVLLSTLSVSGAVAFATTLSVDGAIVAKSTLSLSGAATLNATLSVSGATVLKTTLSVGGATIIEGAVQLGTTLSVSGAAVLKGALSVGGIITNPQACKAWAFVSVGAGTPVIAAGFNIASVTDVGLGDYNIVLSTGMADANYSTFWWTETDANGIIVITHDSSQAKTTTTYRVNIRTQTNNSATDAAAVCGIFYHL